MQGGEFWELEIDLVALYHFEHDVVVVELRESELLDHTGPEAHVIPFGGIRSVEERKPAQLWDLVNNRDSSGKPSTRKATYLIRAGPRDLRRNHITGKAPEEFPEVLDFSPPEACGLNGECSTDQVALEKVGFLVQI